MKTAKLYQKSGQRVVLGADMYHYSNPGIYHANTYQQQCPIFAGSHTNNFEAVILHNVGSTQPVGLEAQADLQVQAPIIEKKKKVVTNKRSVDTSNFSIEERLVAAVWVHERKHTKSNMSQIKQDFRQRFGRHPPAKNTLLVWERKLFSTGSVHDAPRPGRPINRHKCIDEVAASVQTAPALSLRARSLALRVPRTTLRTILHKDLPHTLVRTKETAHSAVAGKQQIKRNVKRQLRRKLESQVELDACAAPTQLTYPRNAYTQGRI